ncbi:MAG: O-acetylhomoserine aminocarboxypropyltransferase/cysteine synthase family protein [Phycisphaerae bacterium]
MSDQKNYRLGTLAVHAGYEPEPTTHSRGVPIYATVAYNFDSPQHAADLFELKEFGNIYSRLMNPTVDAFEKRMAALEGGVAALGFASGMAAITAAVSTICHAGQNFVASTSLYGGTYTLFTQTFKKLGIEARLFDPSEPEKLSELIDENTRCLYFESVGNPKNDVPDFERLADIAHDNGLPVIVDNTVMTPALFRPLQHGADIVVYSATKYIGGHGLHVGGVVVDGGKFQWTDNPEKWPEFCAPCDAYHGMVFAEALKPIGNIAYIIHMRTIWLRDTGGCMSPFAAWTFLLGLETLHLRMERHSENAARVATWLTDHPAVEWVNHPSLPDHPHHNHARKYFPGKTGAIIGFGIKGGRDAGVKFIENVKLASHLANIGDAKTLVIHPASTTHQQLSEEEQASAGVSPEYIRLCVGIEDIDDIKEDVDQALKAAQ